MSAPPSTSQTAGGGEGAGPSEPVVHLSGRRFLLSCAAAALVIAVVGRGVILSPWLLAGEIMATILALFLLGSFRYRLNKNALTYGAGLVTLATFLGIWWGGHGQRGLLTWAELAAWGPVIYRNLLTFGGLDALIHLDTMLFILGLTLLVSVMAQTRLLESASFKILTLTDGRVLPSVLAITAAVAVASGIFAGVSMIGLTIRTLVIILLLARTPPAKLRYAVIVCTVVTTVCGMWMAYGEPPNLIMKANLRDPQTGITLLPDAYFLRYCLPAAIVSFLCVAWNLGRSLHGLRIDIKSLDILDRHAATVRFLQAIHHGRTPTGIEAVEEHAADMKESGAAVTARMRAGEPTGLAMVHENVPAQLRRRVLAELVTPQLADSLDSHYHLAAAGQTQASHAAERDFLGAAGELTRQRTRVRGLVLTAILPFVGLLVWHGLNHHVPLFLSAFAGFGVAITAVWPLRRLRLLALHEAWDEYGEYLFLFPLFLAIALLARVSFFDQVQALLASSVKHAGRTATALGQFYSTGVLSAFLDNNVVADFAAHALHGLPIASVHLFATAQIAGYAVGGCWTHIGSAQSVVAYAFIRRDLDKHYSPMSWLREMTGLLASIMAALTVLLLIESALAG